MRQSVAVQIQHFQPWSKRITSFSGQGMWESDQCSVLWSTGVSSGAWRWSWASKGFAPNTMEGAARVQISAAPAGKVVCVFPLQRREESLYHLSLWAPSQNQPTCPQYPERFKWVHPWVNLINVKLQLYCLIDSGRKFPQFMTLPSQFTPGCLPCPFPSPEGGDAGLIRLQDTGWVFCKFYCYIKMSISSFIKSCYMWMLVNKCL